MQKSLVKLLGVVVLTWSSQVFAVGMGGISVSSSLGQPLKASIELTAVQESEKSGLSARLASPEAYKAAGLDYPYGITFIFTIDENAKTIAISSSQTINAPFVSLLVELVWSAGKLQRDFTFLVDPEGYTPEQPKLAEVQPILPEAQPASGVAASNVAASGVTASNVAASGVADTPILPTNVQSRPLTESETAPVKPAAPASVKIQRGDTLNKVALQHKPADVSLDRMMVALYRVNAQQFAGKNMNRVKTGTILRLPTSQEVNAVSDPEAKKEIRAQTKDWNAYRQKLAQASSGDTAGNDAQQASSGTINNPITHQPPVADNAPKEVLKLSSGDAPTDKAVTAQDKQNAKQEDAIAKAKALQDEQARAALAAKTAADEKHLVELKTQAAALAGASAIPSISGIAAAISAAQAVSGAASAVYGSDIEAIGSMVNATVSVVKPAKIAPPPVPVAPETNLVDDALAIVEPVLATDPLYLAGGAAILLSLGGLAFVINRRKRHPAEAKTNDHAPDTDFEQGFAHSGHEDNASGADSDVDSDAENDADDEETARFYQTQNAASYQPPVSDSDEEEDPIEEARLFLSFGRDAQAEDILKDALKKTPNNHQIHLELLSIYLTRKDINAFAAIAHPLKGAGDEAVWKQVCALGRKLDPNDNTYYSSEELSAATQQLQASVGIKVPDANAMPMLDFDVGALTNKTAAPQKANASALDVNVASATAENPALLAGDNTGSGNILFDITAAHPSVSQKPVSKAHDLPSFNMDFTLPEMPAVQAVAPQSAPISVDFTMPDLIVPSTSHAPANPMDTIDFAMPNFSAPPVPDKPAASPMDTMDFAMPIMDFAPTPAKAAAPSPMATIDFAMPTSIAPTLPEPSAPAIKLDFGDINLHLDDEHSTAHAPGIGESTVSQGMANKLDLARVYIDMEDAESAREFIEEVIREGNPQQIAAAKAMLKQIS